eukprot:9272764-Lingulodinium_polyedra.AAC.1
MGFSWAFYYGQEVHRELARRGLPGAPHLVDRQPAPPVGGARTGVMLYADNAVQFGCQAPAVDAQRAKKSEQRAA